MECRYKKMKLNLEEDIIKIHEEIQELKRLKGVLEDSSYFNLLAGKTQLIGKEKIENIRSRKTHSENIAMQSKRFIKALYETVVDDELKETDIYKLNLERELLYTEIVAMSHDLGHTPFGHLGERIINHSVQGMNISAENLDKILQYKKDIYGEKYELQQGHIQGKTKKISFEHNEQSAKIFYEFCKQNSIDGNKVDIQRIITAILSHSTSRVKQGEIPKDIVAQVIRQVDKLEEYTTNDFEEIKTFINLEAIEDKTLSDFLILPKAEKTKILLQDLLQETLEKGHINDEMTALHTNNKMKKIHHKNIFTMDVDGKKGLLTGENEERISIMLEKIINYYMKNPRFIPDITVYPLKPIEQKQSQYASFDFKNSIDMIPEMKLIDYICGMDDEKVEREYQNLVKARILKGEGHGIEPITIEEVENKKKQAFDNEIQKKKLQELELGGDHSSEECANNLISEIEYRKNYSLTLEARKRMDEVRKKHDEENKKDIELCKLVLQYDKHKDLRTKEIEKERLNKKNRLRGIADDSTLNR